MKPVSILNVAATLLLMLCRGYGQNPISLVQTSENEITLSWNGGLPLFSSTDLSTWTEVSAATSPYVRSIEGVPHEFYSLGLAPPLPFSLDLPPGTFVAGTQTIPLQGSVGSSLSGSAGLRVSIGSVDAEILTDEDGVDRFIFNNLALSAGLNTLTVIVTNDAGASESIPFQVTFDPIEANNVMVSGNYAYAAMGSQGFAVMDLTTRNRTVLSPPGASGSVDDLSVDGDLLFVMDSNGTGFLSVYSISDPFNPVLQSGPVAFTTNFFSGISAANGRVVVSGGTSFLTARSYDANGNLGTDVGSIDLGAGQPDVLISPNGERAFVSTDFSGTFNGQGFGITFLDVRTSSLNIESRTGLAGAGFTTGFQFPANFPIESALSGNSLLVAHGGGLSILDATTGGLQRAIPLGFPAVSVDAEGDTAFIVGQSGGTNSFLAELDLSNTTSQPVVQTLTGIPQVTGVAANSQFIVIAANNNGLQVIER